MRAARANAWAVVQGATAPDPDERNLLFRAAHTQRVRGFVAAHRPRRLPARPRLAAHPRLARERWNLRRRLDVQKGCARR